MGTNYYYCDIDTGKPQEWGHIGKSSGGWCFTLHVYPGVVDTWADWLNRFRRSPGVIKNEYDEGISITEFIDVVTRRRGNPLTLKDVRASGSRERKPVPQINPEDHWTAQLAVLVSLGYEAVEDSVDGGWTIFYPDAHDSGNLSLQEAVRAAVKYQGRHQFGDITVQSYLNANHAVMGPDNLLRHRIDGVHCIGHGGGTYDYCVGEFS